MSRNSILVSLFGFLLPFCSFAQRGETMSPTQWWLGLKAGTSATSVSVPESYFVLNSPIDQGIKDYAGAFDKLGYHVGLEASFDILGKIEITFQPGLRYLKYSYQNEWAWADTSGVVIYGLTNLHHQTLSYLDLPLIVKYNILSPGHGKISIKGKDKDNIKVSSGGGIITFVQGGVFYNKLLNADKTITKTVLIDEATSTDLFQKNIKSSFINSSYGWAAGFGLGYDFQSARLVLDALYRKGFHNLTREQARYTDRVLVDEYYDVPDNIKLSNWEFSLHVLFPFKFVYSGSFKKF